MHNGPNVLRGGMEHPSMCKVFTFTGRLKVLLVVRPIEPRILGGTLVKIGIAARLAGIHKFVVL